jgi:hypothetical protein
MKTLEQITETLESLSDNNLKDLWNEYQYDNHMERAIYAFDDEFFENFFSTPAEAARAVYFGEIENWNAKYVCFNGAGNIEAANSLESLISIYDLANHIEANQEDYSSIC